MTRRPTLADVARAAGVGSATVDRVLNGRAVVRPETARLVFEAARAIGYHGVGLLRRRIDEATSLVRLGFLLQRPEQPFYQAFEAELRAATANATGAKLVPEIGYLPAQNPAEIVAALQAMARRAQAIAMVAIDHPSVTAAVAELREQGVPVFSLLSDFAAGARREYLGLNNRKAGRTSGWLLARCMPKPGKVAILVGSHRFHGHEMREIGCRSYLRETAPAIEIIDTQASLEDAALAREAVLGLLRRHPDLTGLYLAGGGMEGAIAALREETLPGRIATVCNEITETSRAALADNVISAVIATPLDGLARMAVSHMLAALADPLAAGGGQSFLPFEIFISENI